MSHQAVNTNSEEIVNSRDIIGCLQTNTRRNFFIADLSASLITAVHFQWPRFAHFYVG
jgi:hypothetical protein